MKAAVLFSSLIAQTMATQHASYAFAERAVAKSHPDLAAIVSASQKTGASIQFTNDQMKAKAAKPDKASLHLDLQKQAKDLMKQLGISYQAAWGRVSQGHALFANDDFAAVQSAASGSGGTPPLTPALAQIFRIPSDTDSGTWSRIWKQNGGTASTVNYGKVFQACLDAMQGEGTGSIEDTIPAAQKKFPQLWSAVETLAALSF